MGRPEVVSLVRGTDWLAVAIGNMGGIGQAARKMGVSRQTIYNWLEQGLGTIEFEKVVRLAKQADVPLDYIARRLGPWKE